jgi:uncharacterized Zn finger protein
MSPWDRSRFYPPSQKQPPPEHGIRMKKAGTTWWGQRWIEALEQVLRGDAGRLSRGRTYARAGRAHDLTLASGQVSARVTGSRITPYEVRIELAQLPDACWQEAIAGMAAKAQFSAELLSGTMPERIDDVFLAAKTSLFPKQRRDLVTSCSCPDDGDPCKHVAATHYLIGEALDRDPFLLFELRGRTKEQVLAALREARSAGSVAGAHSTKRLAKSDARSTAEPWNPAGAPKVTLGKIRPQDYDRARQPLPALQFNFDTPLTHGALLKQLGAPPAWRSENTPADTLAPLVSAAAAAARKIALGEPPPPSVTSQAASPPAESPAPPKAATARPAAVHQQPPVERASKRKPAKASAANRAAGYKSEPTRQQKPRPPASTKPRGR